jgi:hypothetical protein
MSDELTPEMIDTAEANIRADYSAGKTSKEQFQKEMRIVSTARRQAREIPNANKLDEVSSSNRARTIKQALIGAGIAAYAAMAVFTFGLIWNSTECYASRYGAAYDASRCRENKAANSMVSAIFWPFALSAQIQKGSDE